MLLVSLLLGCNVTPIDNGAELGPLVQVRTTFTSALVGLTPKGGVVAFDAGFNRNARPIERELEDRGVALTDVEAVFLTHHHTDHIAGLDALGGQVVAHEDEVDLLAAEEITVDRTVEDGEIVNVGGWDVEVFHVPGHTPGSAVYLVEQVLVMGDVAIQQRNGTVGPAPEGFSEDPERAQQELCALLDRVRDRDVQTVAYAHSGPSTLEGLLAAEGCAL